ncbi:MAG: hypothetical protein ACYTFW_00210 [Planctomycetota bacterium]|jgi:hypothetical protein
MVDKRKYPPGPEMETIERLIKRRDELEAQNADLLEALRAVDELLEALRAVDEWFEGDRKNEPKTWLELGKLVKQAIAKAESE